MKKYIIRNAQGIDVDDSTDELYAITYSGTATGDENMTVSDGYHTMDELYDHRIALFIALCKDLEGNGHPNVWRSKKHSDDTEYEGWFIMGINTEPGEQITYHLPMSEWENTNIIKERKNAPEWDGHTSDDVLTRIKSL